MGLRGGSFLGLPALVFPTGPGYPGRVNALLLLALPALAAAPVRLKVSVPTVTAVMRWQAASDFTPYLASKSIAPAADVFRLKAPEKARMQSILAGLPESERQAEVMILKPHRDAPWMMGEFALQNLLAGVYEPVKDGLFVPSFSAMQAALLARYEKEAVRLLPSFEPVDEDEILAGIVGGGRVLGVQTPSRPYATEADGFEMGKHYFTQHDFLHAWFGSKIPAKRRAELAANPPPGYKTQVADLDLPPQLLR